MTRCVCVSACMLSVYRQRLMLNMLETKRFRGFVSKGPIRVYGASIGDATDDVTRLYSMTSLLYALQM